MEKTFKFVQYSTLENDGKIQLSQNCERLLTGLLGIKYRHYYDCKLSQKEWKILIKKCIEKLEITINNTIETDTHHKFCIQSYIDNLKECIKDNKNILPEIIVILQLLCFELIGGIPNIERFYQQNKYYVSTRNRSIDFKQNIRQKVNTIFQATGFIGFNDLTDKELDIQYSKFNFNPKKFLNWFKVKYPSYYAKLF